MPPAHISDNRPDTQPADYEGIIQGALHFAA
uniref:Neurospora crassa DNA for RNA polymerase I second-largest subunit n=1 Tax=Neurospora crassa TaxID=5141 RepID=V9H0X7_NEUCS|nr:hypothetical protein - Neurospora crassa [Neurospora crassa]BAA33444.1 unnamed protein product [Neurospora crassa]